jgi:hypothetical protein
LVNPWAILYFPPTLDERLKPIKAVGYKPPSVVVSITNKAAKTPGNLKFGIYIF